LVVVYRFIDSHKDINVNKVRMPTAKNFFKGESVKLLKG